MKAIVVALAASALLAGAAAASSGAGWHRCQTSDSLCDGSGRVLFPYVIDQSESSGIRAVVTGFRRTGARTGVADVRGDWGIIFGDCGQSGVVRNCEEWAGVTHIRYSTSDGGRHWRPVSFRRHVAQYEGPGPSDPLLVGSVDDRPPTKPCSWDHAHRHALVQGLGGGYGNWCSPDDAWKVPDSLQPSS